MAGVDKKEKWKYVKREVGEKHEKYVGRCLIKVFMTAEGCKSFDGGVEFVH